VQAAKTGASVVEVIRGRLCCTACWFGLISELEIQQSVVFGGCGLVAAVWAARLAGGEPDVSEVNVDAGRRVRSLVWRV